jgi:PAS domain S-box-containing protein
LAEWGEHHWVLLTSAICVTQALLIGGLLLQRMKRRRATLELKQRISEREDAEQALRQSEARYRGIVEDQTELICRLLPDGTYSFVNGAYCRYFHQTPDQLLGRSLWSLIPAEAHPKVRGHLAAITPDHPVATIEHEVIAPGGHIRWQQWTDRAFFDQHGQVVEYQSVGRDITERKRAEEQKLQLEAQKQAAAALREADRRKDQFLAMVSHELRDPLAALNMALTLLDDSAMPAEDARNALDVMGRQVLKLNRLVDDLLDVARITSSKINLQRAPLDFRKVVAEAVETSRPWLLAREQTLLEEIQPSPLMVNGDAVRLAQVVSNLLSNASKYSPIGGNIRLSAREQGAQMVVTVSDRGVGISTELLERVFGPFVQGGDPAVGTPGLGLGLTLVRRLTEMHGGQVEAHSEGEGKGSEFVVRLPAVPAPAQVGPPAPAPVSASPSPRRILVVDDNVDSATSLARVLQRQAHQVEVAHDGRAALLAAEVGHPDVVLLDIAMPGLDGLEVARYLRRREGPHPLLVAITGYGRSEDRRRTAEAGFDHHLVKPVNLQTLRSLLEQTSTRQGESERRGMKA